METLSSPDTLIDSMKATLKKELHATFVEIIDDSAKHAGHAHGGGRHFRLTVVAPCFEGLSRLERQRKVLDLFKDLMPHTIHALSMKALSVGEWGSRDSL